VKTVNTENSRDRKSAYRLLGVQLMITAFFSVFGYFFSPMAGASFFIGGAIGLIANSWLAFVIFRPRAASSPEKLLKSLYLGEVGKFLFVMALFAIAFRAAPILGQPENALIMLLAFAATQVLHWLWPLMTKKEIKPE